MASTAQKPPYNPIPKASRIAYAQHREAVRNICAKVDSYPPNLYPAFYMKVAKLSAGTSDLARVVLDNKQIVKGINVVYRTTGKVDCHMKQMIKPQRDLSKELRRDTAFQITQENLDYLERLTKTEPVYKNAEFLREWRQNEKIMAYSCKYPLYWQVVKSEDDIEAERRWTVRNSGMSLIAQRSLYKKLRPRVFLEVSTTNNRHLGRMEIELYRDVVPKTTENFLSYVRGDNEEKLSYKGCPFFRINTSLYCQSGDVAKHYGLGSKSIYGDQFNDENFRLKHAGPGMLTTYNPVPNSNTSQFLITFKALHTLNGRSVAFGRVIKGLRTVYNIEEMGTNTGMPIAEVIISNCGEIDY